MNILAINGSPHGNLGNTDLILQPLLRGMESTGAKTETIYLNKINIKHCIGCFNCWFKTPGKCIHHDDMAPLLEKKRSADLIIYATPLYVFSTTGLMKVFLDRGIPNLMPFFEENSDGSKLTKHPERYPRTAPQKMLLVSSCGFPEEKHFAPLIQTFKHAAEENGTEYIGEILKPAAWLLKEEDMCEKANAYYADLYTAGKYLITQGKIDAELLKKLHQSWLSDHEIRAMVNKEFHSMLNDKR
ncbi:MAG: hypothetical protein A2X78_00450 [Gammaproteobacteria bacterium GWE2_37_16]|nr:MAG: hypothetical protein A2X78_00450 [Gammaproteobacteria bacterium GWE2_37_16]